MSIKLENINYIYGKGGPFEKTALKNINLEIGENEFIGIIGHTGSGKSTLIQLFNGLLKPESGNVFVDGENINEKGVKLKKIREKVGMVFQYPEYQLFEETVFKDIKFGLDNFGFAGDKDKRVKETAKTIGIDEEMLESSPFNLSGGQKRRVAIAGILALEPKYLILDEPAAGLDPYGRNLILDELYKIYKERKITIILVSHSMEDIAKYADRIIVMNKGEIAIDDKPSEVFKREEVGDGEADDDADDSHHDDDGVTLDQTPNGLQCTFLGFHLDVSSLLIRSRTE